MTNAKMFHRRNRFQNRVDPRGELAVPRRLETGIRGLDEMLNGGIPEGDSVLVVGPAGSGKTLFAQQFVTHGIQNGEPGVMVTFEEHPLQYQNRAERFGLDLKKMVSDDQLSIIYLRPLDLSVDETLQEIQDTVRKIKAKRVSIDSLSGFELASPNARLLHVHSRRSFSFAGNASQCRVQADKKASPDRGKAGTSRMESVMVRSEPVQPIKNVFEWKFSIFGTRLAAVDRALAVYIPDGNVSHSPVSHLGVRSSGSTARVSST
jgi:KaiC